MASIKPRTGKNGVTTYLITVSKGRGVDGKKITESITFKPTKTTPKAIEKEVQKFALDFEERVKAGKYFSGEKVTFSDVAEKWVATKANINRAQTTFESYQDILKLHVIPFIGNMKISLINPMTLEGMIEKWKAEGFAVSSIRRYFAVVKLVFKYAFKGNVIENNPCDRVELPKASSLSSKEIHYFNVEQSTLFLHLIENGFTINHPEKIRKNGIVLPAYSEDITFSSQWLAYFHLAIYGGFRRGELIALTWNDIDFDNRTVDINKARSRTKEGTINKEPKTIAGYREIQLPADCFKVLQIWKKEQRSMMLLLGKDWKGKTGRQFDQNNIFIQIKNGLPMDLSTPSHKFKEIIQMYNSTCTKEEEKLPDIHLHDLRHTSVTVLLANHVDLETVSHRHGHSKPSITLDVYGHWMEETDRTASDTLESIFSRKQA